MSIYAISGLHADLCDPTAMPPVLVKAHQALDRAVDACYRKTAFTRRRGCVGLRSANPTCGASTPTPVDVNVLKKLIGDDEAMIREFLHDFHISAEETAAELRTACAAGQTAVAGALAHKLKSPARAVGALALGELCAEMEKAGKAGDAEALTMLLPKFEQELASVESFLEM